MSGTAVVTGVSGGIGEAVARRFLDDDWEVIGISRRDVQLPGNFVHIPADISSPSEILRIGEEIRSTLTSLNVLVNNAAYQVCAPISETSYEDYTRVMNTNLMAPFFLSKELLSLLSNARGAVVNISSVHAHATSGNIAAYAASKGGLMALTRAMAIEFAEDGVRVNAVLPGAVDTQMLENGLSRDHVSGASLEERKRSLAEKHLLGRIGKPEEIAEAVFFLAENRTSSFITGQGLVVDGGALTRLSTE